MVRQWQPGMRLGRRWSPVQIRPPRPTFSVSCRRSVGIVAFAGLASLLQIGCSGGSLTGPSPVAVATPQAAPTPPSFPAGVDPAYVRTIAIVSASGIPKHWEGGPFHHCFNSKVDQPQITEAIAMMSAVSGIPQTDEGPCNVQWTVDDQAVAEAGLAGFAELHGSDTAITYARVALHHNFQWVSLHEAGHVLGLNHSPRPGDLMHPRSGSSTKLSGDERAVLAWIYGR